MNRFLQYILLVWLPSLLSSWIPSGFLHVVVVACSHYIRILLNEHTTVFFIYSTIDGYPSCFWFGNIFNRDPKNIASLLVFWWTYVQISVVYIPGSGIVESNIFRFSGSSFGHQTFKQCLVYVHHPASRISLLYSVSIQTILSLPLLQDWGLNPEMFYHWASLLFLLFLKQDLTKFRGWPWTCNPPNST